MTDDAFVGVIVPKSNVTPFDWLLMCSEAYHAKSVVIKREEDSPPPTNLVWGGEELKTYYIQMIRRDVYEIFVFRKELLQINKFIKFLKLMNYTPPPSEMMATVYRHADVVRQDGTNPKPPEYKIKFEDDKVIADYYLCPMP